MEKNGRNIVQDYLKDKLGVSASEQEVEELVKFIFASKGLLYTNFSKQVPKMIIKTKEHE